MQLSDGVCREKLPPDSGQSGSREHKTPWTVFVNDIGAVARTREQAFGSKPEDAAVDAEGREGEYERRTPGREERIRATHTKLGG